MTDVPHRDGDVLDTAVSLRRAADREALERNLRLCQIVLENIAHGYWNAGRETPISAQEYASDFIAQCRPFATRRTAGFTLAREIG